MKKQKPENMGVLAAQQLIALNPMVSSIWLCRFPRGHNAVEIRTASQVLTLYVTKTGRIRVFKKGQELK